MHDNLANALRLVVAACSCQSAAETRYRALARKKGMVECVRSSDGWLCAASVLSLGVCENRDGWLVAWGFCG